MNKKEIFQNTTVTQALRRQLNMDGTWNTLWLGELSAEPDTPPSGVAFFYAKTNGQLYWKIDSGLEREIANVASGTGLNTALSNPDSPIIISFGNNDAGTNNTILGSDAGGNIEASAEGNNLVGDAAGFNITTGDNNIGFGNAALFNLTTGSRNIGIGQIAGRDIVTENDNIAIGYQALTTATAGQNIAIGTQALESSVSGIGHIAIGYQAMQFNVEGSENIAIGYQAMQANTGGDENIALGDHALFNNTVGSTNIAIGKNAMQGNMGGLENIAIGFDALGGNTFGGVNVALGKNAMLANTIGSNNIAIGQSALVANTTGNNNHAYGQSALGQITLGSDNIGIGDKAGFAITTTDFAVFVGHQAAQNGAITKDGTVGVGYKVFHDLTTGDKNTGVGYLVGQELEDGDENTLMGYNVAPKLTGGDRNTIIGAESFSNDTSASLMSDLTLVGTSICTNVLTTGADGTTAIGSKAMEDLTSGARNTAVGFNAAQELTTGSFNTTIGYGALDDSDNDVSSCVAVGDSALGGVLTSDADGAVAIGSSALAALTSGAHNTAVGFLCFEDLTTGSYNTGLGHRAGKDLTTGEGNTLLGDGVAIFLKSGNGNTFVGEDVAGNQSIDTDISEMTIIGHEAGLSALKATALGATGVGSFVFNDLTSGAKNVAMGYQAATNLTTGSNNVMIGYMAGSNIIGGSNNTFLGNESGIQLGGGFSHLRNTAVGNISMAGGTVTVTLTDNTAVGHSSLRLITEGLSNTAIGSSTLAALTTADQCTAVGVAALPLVTTGSNNTAIGEDAGGNITTGSGNVCVGIATLTSGSASIDEIVIGNNPTGIANSITLGSATERIHTVLTSVAWTHSSDERQKKDITNFAPGLKLVNGLRPVKFRFKSRSEYPEEWTSYNPGITEPSTREIQYGFIAQEVRKALDDAGHEGSHPMHYVGVDGRQGISVGAMLPAAINAIQDLDKKISRISTRKGIKSESSYVKLIDVKPSGENGGRAVQDQWSVRDIREASDVDEVASVSSNEITLVPGLYRCDIVCPGVAISQHQIRLYDIINEDTILTGISSYAHPNGGSNNALLRGQLTVTDTTVLQIQHNAKFNSGDTGFGLACDFGPEVYTIAEFWKLK